MSGTEKFEKLLSPIEIRHVKTRNRMFCPAHTTYFGKDGYVTDIMVASYEALAKGGVGMIVIEFSCVDYPMGIDGLKQLGNSDDKFIPSLARLSQAVHKHGCPVFLQLAHSGPAQPEGILGQVRVSSSSLSDAERPPAVPGGAFGWARELTIAEIQELVGKFARAAERAKKAGYDGVEIHGAHPYLVNSFFSRVWNKRSDQYGCQNLENRARFATEIVRAIKERVGQDFPVGFRINGAEYGHERATTPEEAQEFAKLMQAAGVDYLSVSAYGFGDFVWVHYPDQLGFPDPDPAVMPLKRMVKKPGTLVPLAEGIKKVTSIPVVAVGRLGPELGEWILQNNKADLIGMVRRLMADPELPNKVASGRLEDVRPCTACVECTSKFVFDESIKCRVNAALGRELEYTIEPAKKRRRVLVIGGGPAGMEAARVASLRGHEVILCEKERKLGGLLPLASLIKGPDVEDLEGLVRYFKTQLTKNGVKVMLGKEANLALIGQINPDAIVVAVGGVPDTPQIPGIDRKDVIKSSALHARVKPILTLLGPRLLAGLTNVWMPIGKKVVIIGGLIQGCELAEFLVKRGRTVTIVEASNDLGAGIPVRKKVRLIAWLGKKKVTMLTGVKYEGISDKGLSLLNKDGQKMTLSADNFLLALPFRPDTSLAENLKAKFPEVHLIGDCSRPSLIIDAINEGFSIGRTL